MHLRRFRPALLSTKSLLLALLLASLLLPIACGNADERRVLVYAAASLRDILTGLEEEYETANNVHVAFNWGGSVALANQLKRHAPGDVFISAGSAPMDDLEEVGLLASGTRTILAANSLVLVVSSESEIPRQSAEEVILGADRVGIADPALSPAGRYARESLQSMGLWREIQSRVVFGANVRTALAYVESGAVDAGVVYRTDALNNKAVRIVHELPPQSHSPILYPMATLKDARNPRGAFLFMGFLSEESTQPRLRHYGFDVVERP